MLTQRERTARAQGTMGKPGSTRRIAVTLSERMFYDIRNLAIADDRSISAVVTILLEKKLEDSRNSDVWKTAARRGPSG